MTPGAAGGVSALLTRVIGIAEDAGRAAMAHYDRPAATGKADGSPVTLADLASDAVIAAGLGPLLPSVAVVSEEGAPPDQAPSGRRFWLVDPLDGTREFLSRNGEFTVNIALVEDGVPVLGVVVAPALGLTYAADAQSGAVSVEGGRVVPIRTRAVPPAGVTVVSSRSHGDAPALAAWLGDRPVAGMRAAGSSLKLCLVACGQADLYPRLGPTMEWDIAAGDAILRAAGGSVRTLDGGTLAYGKDGFRNPPFVASGEPGGGWASGNGEAK